MDEFEGLESQVIYEFPASDDEDTDRNFSQTCFNNTASVESMPLTDISQIDSSAEIEMEKKKFMIVQPCKILQKEKDDDSAFMNVNTTPHGRDSSSSENEKWAEDNNNKDTEYKNANSLYLMYLLRKRGSNGTVCSSDEFADVEDNVQDSSSDTCEIDGPRDEHQSAVAKNAAHEIDSEEQEIQNTTAVGSASTSRINTPKRNTGQCSNKQENKKFRRSYTEIISPQTENKNVVNADDKICHADPRSHKMNPINSMEITLKAKSSMEKNFMSNMPTISEVPEEENRTLNKIPANNTATNSKTNPLKMKSKVPQKNRCGVCNIRLGLCAIRCRCGNFYCAKHRYDRDHNCSFDYKAMGVMEIRKNNPKVIAEKVRKL